MEDLLTLIKSRRSTRGLFDTEKPLSKEDINLSSG